MKSTDKSTQHLILPVESDFRHKKTIIQISYDAAYIKCSCGWESITAYATDERVPHYQDADNDYEKHIDIISNKGNLSDNP